MTTSSRRYNFTIDQGATLGKVMTWKDSSGTAVNLTGYTARMKAKERRPGTATVLTLTTENGGIALGGAAGTITLSMSAAATAALTAQTLDYDLELVSGGGAVTRLLQGCITVDGEITT